MIPEREREALMRLTMCAREECRICKYENTCGFDFQCDLATKSMNILADALRKAFTPQTDCYDYSKSKIENIKCGNGISRDIPQTELRCENETKGAEERK